MRENKSKEQGGGLGRFAFIPTSRTEYSLTYWPSLNYVVISTLPFVMLFYSSLCSCGQSISPASPKGDRAVYASERYVPVYI